jgi:hypothetical protein
LENKYLPNNNDYAIYHYEKGFSFGYDILLVKAINERLNYANAGRCVVDINYYYDLEAVLDENSPLTGEKDNFTCEHIEVFKIIPRKTGPAKKDAAPAKKEAAPAKKEAAPAKKDAAPPKKK